jgi:glycosyltransferase involved in cell wall biosynthesis
MKPSVLFVAFHYPPIQMSSGVHRTVAFSRYLADNDWNVSVLTVNQSAYNSVNNLSSELIPKNVQVIRAFSFDTARDLSFKGKYFSWMAQPDRWLTWVVSAVYKGWRHLRKDRAQVIVSTYPIATAHIIGYLLHKLTGRVWVADLRDPMLQDNYPSDPTRRRIFQWIESKIVKHASLAILTSPGAIELYRQRYSAMPESFWRLIPNGFDEQVFAGLQKSSLVASQKKYTILHSGTIYPEERDPTQLFVALQQLKEQHPAISGKIAVVLRATGHDNLFTAQLKQYQIEDMVQLLPSLDYRSAAAEMLDADALLLLQGESCNYQTPAKAYEYIRAQRPLLVLAPKESDTYTLVKQTNVALQANLNSSAEIVETLALLVSRLDQNNFQFLSLEDVNKFSRQYGAAMLQHALAELQH